MNPFDLQAHITDEHCDESSRFVDHVDELDSDDLRRLHDFLHDGRAVAVKADHKHA